MTKFWCENPSILFNDIQLFCHPLMSLEEQLNTITRLLLIVTLILWIFDFKYVFKFMVFSLLIIIIIYFNQKKIMTENKKENFAIIQKEDDKHVPYIRYNIIKNKNIDKTEIFCDDAFPLENEKVIKFNQNLSGNKANPKTKIAPIIVPPSYDLDSWKQNNFTIFSNINAPSLQQDVYLSGYETQNYNQKDLLPNIQKKNFQNTKRFENFSFEEQSQIYQNDTNNIKNPNIDNNILPIDKYNNLKNQNFRNNYNFDNINVSCGYNPKQLNVNLPSNYPAGNCQQNQKLKDFNENLFTQTITPGFYMKNEINEPINSNIGISYSQQFQTFTQQNNERGEIITLKDPNNFESHMNPSFDDQTENFESEENPNYDNIYDPRFYGYGTSYRNYVEPITGQPRFFYDDINAIKMPNYITRSKIDHLPYSDHYGPIQENNEFGNNNLNIRELAQDSWFNDSFSFRNDMTQRLMRKINSEGWQKRMYPNSTRFSNSSSRIK